MPRDLDMGIFWFGKSEMIEMEIQKNRSETFFFGVTVQCVVTFVCF